MDVIPAKTQISLDTHPAWSEPLLYAQWVAKDPSFLHADSEECSDRVDTQAKLGLRWAHMPLCWYCLELAHILLFNIHILHYENTHIHIYRKHLQKLKIFR